MALVKLLAALVLVVSFAAPTSAETRFALIIGNSDYQGAGDLPNAENDANLMEAAFTAAGFDTSLLLDIDETEFGAAIDDLEKRAAELDAVAIYYAGHGIQKDSRNFLIPVDATLETETAVEREAISLDSIMEVLERVPVSLLFLDACRNNPFAEQLAENAQASGRSAKITRGLAVVRPVGDMLITFATLPNSVALDGTGDNSPFARALANHMRTPDTEVSVLMKRVTRDVILETEGSQRPQQLSQMQREFYFNRTSSGQTTKDDLRSVLSVYPASATTDEEIAVVADVGAQCQPAFFDLSTSGKVTTIPQRFFKRIALGNGQTRFEISPGSRYGLVVQEADERGEHTLGFFCEPAGISKDDKVSLLKNLKSQFDAGTFEGSLDAGSTGEALYHFRQYEIR